jgi:ribosomal protein S18 acetylase RimI-like enzyme
VLSRAFADDPLMAFVLPDGRLRDRRLPRLFRTSLRHQYLTHGEVYTTADVAGGSLWSPPGQWRPPPSVLVTTLPGLLLALGAQLPRALQAVTAVERVHPAEAHWYLAVLGTDPPRQGEGIGSALLAPALARCDHDGVPAYLESSKESNLAFYGRHGFEVTGTIDLPDGPRLWPMWREPRR